MKTILVVDDDMQIQNMYKRFLEDEGFTVWIAPNANIGNELLKQNKIDLVLLDINMPDAYGDVLYEYIKMFHRNSKVIVSSVYPTDVQKNFIKEADDYYDKSQDFSVLLDKIKAVLNNKAT